jgi:membrane-bound lytic murein transglycosylase C
METESSFNPMAKSHIPAYGLMQIVPHTAGKDATSYLYGKSKILAPSYLYKPENNITIGAAYLHLLHYKYMRRIKNPQSRMYCAIAAYNTGASNVAKAFINRASFNKAVTEINKLKPAQVYDKLRNYLPRKETRKYVEKVSKRMEKYL